MWKTRSPGALRILRPDDDYPYGSANFGDRIGGRPGQAGTTEIAVVFWTVWHEIRLVSPPFCARIAIWEDVEGWPHQF
jgi:hypothetical protein